MNHLLCARNLRFLKPIYPAGRRDPYRRSRRGTVIVLAAVLMVTLFGFVALAVDMGYLYLVRTQLQRSADAAALAGAGSLYSLSDDVEQYSFYLEPDISATQAEAQKFAAFNGGGKYQSVSSPSESQMQADIVTGRFHDASNMSLAFIPDETSPNTVQASIRLRDDHANGSVALFFARVLGSPFANVEATASATLIHASLLPFATSEEKWNSLAEGGDGDNFAYSHGVSSGQGDGIPEITIFPDLRWDGQDLPPGNFGALSIGTPTSSAATLRRQIDQGPTSSELQYHGSLSEGVVISGKTGLNATVKVAFNGGYDTSDLRYYEGIIGHPRFLPVYSHVEGNGTLSQFTIKKFVAVRVVEANLKGKQKWITLQPIENAKNLMAMRLTR